MGIPGCEKVVMEIDTLPNAELEAFYRQGSVKGINRFGQRKKPHQFILDLVAEELNRRAEEGTYVYTGRAEQLRLKPVNIKDPKVDPMNADI